MPRFAANLSMMFTELPFLDRFAAASRAGFRAVEYLFPYEFPAEEIAERLRSFDLQQVLFNAPAGDWDAGERGLASLPGRDAEFDAAIANALRYAAVLDCPQIHVMAGVPGDQAPHAAEDVFVERMTRAADAAAAAGRRLLVEPINARDMPGYLISSVPQALDLIERIDRNNVALQFDVYHAQITEGDITRLTEHVIGRAAHVQIASVPERHEPGTGELDDTRVFALLDALGYDGWVGCEYRPATTTEAGLEWFAPYRERKAS